MRLAGQVKMGYYPTPPGVVQLIRKQFYPPEHTIHAIDPCCGEGLALEALLRGTGAITYGIELDAARAAEAKEHLKNVAHAGYEEVEVALESMSLLYLNPPYDDGEGERKELTFLRDLMPVLIHGGLLVYIIPRTRLTADVAEFLAASFSRLKVYRFPEPEYDAFGQIVVLGTKNGYPVRGHPEDLLREVADPELAILPASVFERYQLPLTGNAEMHVRKHPPEELVTLAKASPIWTRVQDLVEPPALGDVGRPPAPLHEGHMGLLLAAGCLNGQVGTGAERHIVVGKPVKHIIESSEVEEDEEGNSVEVTHRLETFRVTIKMLMPTGELRRLV